MPYSTVQYDWYCMQRNELDSINHAALATP